MDRLGSERPATSALGGLRVLELSPTLAGAHVGQLFADFGAEVVSVERPGGSPLRALPGFPFWFRGKKSIELDLRDGAGAAAAQALAAASDVVVDTFRPGVAARLGLGYEDVAAANPRVVYASLTGFGRQGPYAGLQGYEALVFAKVGGCHVFGPGTERRGPAVAAVPYCTWSAAQTALHGVLAALVERERSGRGQWVETSMAQAIAAHDPYGWLLHTLIRRYPDAFTASRPFTEEGPVSPLFAFVLVALSRDGDWLQFSQAGPRLFQALLRSLDLGHLLADPEWAGVPVLPRQEQRTALWTMLLEAVRQRTTAEWQELFERDHNVWAEVFRQGTELLDHPQIRHDRQAVEIVDPERGPVRQPGPLVRLDGTPAVLGRPAPRRDEHGAELRASAATRRSTASTRPSAGAEPPPTDTPPADAPLAGLTLLELGVWYAGPHAATLLTDLGIRVIKVEPLEGDPLRSSVPFPEAGGAKALQGKESIAVDMATPEGRAIVHELARRSDIVLQAFRAGVAERLGIDAATLRAVNPDLVYLNAPGYGVDGPCGDRPAFGPTIGAGTGLALRNVGPSIGSGPDLTLQQVKDDSVRLATVNYSAFASADGLGSLGAATGLLLGLLARARGADAQTMLTTMLGTVAHTLSDDMVEYPGRAAVAAPDAELLGFHALYRLYETSAGWVFLAAPQPKEWQALGTALAPYADLLGDPRFASPADRADRAGADAALAGVLARIFAQRGAAAWEQDLMAAGVGCVAVTEQLPEEFLQSAEFGAASGFLTDVEHPTFGPIPRLAPVVRFSRSAVTPRGGCLLGQHTEAILHELGHGEAEIADLVARHIVAV